MIDLRARPELRDDDPSDGGGGTTAIPNGTGNRMVDTGFIVSNSEYIVGSEMLYVRGPLSFQAEYAWAFVDSATGVAPSLGGAVTALPGGPQNYCFSGGYAQVAYTLTGENRAYDKRLGTLARAYFGPQGPYEKMFITRGPDGCSCWGLGAWELACRYIVPEPEFGRWHGPHQRRRNGRPDRRVELLHEPELRGHVRLRQRLPLRHAGGHHGPADLQRHRCEYHCHGRIQGFGIRAQLQF